MYKYTRQGTNCMPLPDSIVPEAITYCQKATGCIKIAPESLIEASIASPFCSLYLTLLLPLLKREGAALYTITNQQFFHTFFWSLLNKHSHAILFDKMLQVLKDCLTFLLPLLKREGGATLPSFSLS